MLRGRRVKPGQVGKRVVFERYGIRGSAKDRLFTALLYGVGRKRGLVDRVLSRMGIEIEGVNPYVLALLRLLVIERFFGKKSSDILAALLDYGPIAVGRLDRSVDIATVRDLAKKVLGFEYSFSGGDEDLEFRFSAPAELVKRVVGLLGAEEAERFFKAVEELRYLSFRVNTLKTSVEEVVRKLSRDGYSYEIGSIVPTVVRIRGPFDYAGSPLFTEGKIIPQDEASALASILLDPRPGETVVDLCAAPGGKTTHIAELMKNHGRVIAVELYRDRARRLRHVLRRAGVSIAEVHVLDGRDAPRVFGEGVADKVLVDPPCSNTGALSKSPDARWRFSPAKIEELVSLQRGLLESGLRLLKPGGRLLYTTCSVLPEENEDNIKWLLARFSECIRIVPLRAPVDQGFLPGTLRTWPHRHRVMGFFYALIERLC